MIEFVKSLQEIKEKQKKWQDTDLSQRKAILQVYFEKVLEKIGDAESNYDRQFDLKIAGRQLKQLLSNNSTSLNARPTGLVTLVIDKHSPIFLLLHQVGSSLLAGNATYVYFSDQYSDIVYQTFRETLPEMPAAMFGGGKQLLEIMLTHPSISAVGYYGGKLLGDEVLNFTKGSSKKLQISCGYHNAALVLADADLELAARSVVDAFYIGKGLWPVNISEVFVLEANAKEFVEHLEHKLIELMKKSGPYIQGSETSRFKLQIGAEKGKFIFGAKEDSPIVVEDFNHCSSLHQESLEAPILFIQPVKYAHEMAKWIKAFDHGGLAIVFGSDEKVQKIGSQIGVSKVIANGWVEKMNSLPLGSRKTFIGINDPSAFGLFYSDHTTFDGLVSKD